MFLALCGAAGVLAGRLTRGAVAANTSVDSPSSDVPDDESRRRASETTPEYSTVAAPMVAPVVEEYPPTYEDNRTMDLTQPVETGYAPAPGYGTADPGYGTTDPLDPIADPNERPGGVR